MFSMFLMNAAAVTQWVPFGVNITINSLALVEPIIFLSGFLICLRTVPQVQGGKYLRAEVMRKFAVRRIVRTWPLYFMVVAVCFIWPAMADLEIRQPLWKFLTFTMNVDLDVRSGLASMWTLCIEEWCYLIFLLLIPLFAPRRNIWIFLSLAAASVAIRFYIVYSQGPFINPISYMMYLKFPTWSHCDSFFLGCAFAEVFRVRGEIGRAESYISLALALGVAVLYYISIDLWTAYYQITIPLWGAVFSAFFIWGLPVIDDKWLRRTGLVHLGWMSYTIYLIHKITIEKFVDWSRGRGVLEAGSTLEMAGAFAFTCVVGAVLFWILEKPILQVLRRPYFSPSPIHR